MKITTDLTKEDYLTLIKEARGDIVNHTSHKLIKMIIGNYKIIAEMLESQNVYVDNKKYYVGDYYLKDKNFDMKFISYNLYK